MVYGFKNLLLSSTKGLSLFLNRRRVK